MNWDVFRAYDIRGVYPDDINEEDYYRIAKGYVYLFKPKTMVVGMDARASSPPLKASLTRGFLDAGVDVVDIGEITTDMLYFTAGAFPYSGGVVVSAARSEGASSASSAQETISRNVGFLLPTKSNIPRSLRRCSRPTVGARDSLR